MRLFFFCFVFFLSSSPAVSQYISNEIPDNFGVCSGATLKIAYNSDTHFTSSNIFTAQLLNGFNSIVASIGTHTSSQKSDSILITIPSGVTSGRYFIRIVSSSPAITGEISNGFQIGVPLLPGLPNGSLSLCKGNTLRLSTVGTVPGTKVWTGPSGFISRSDNLVLGNVTAEMSGTYSVKMEYAGGCSGNSRTVNVSISDEQAPPKPLAFSNSPICSGDLINLSANDNDELGFDWFNTKGISFSTDRNVQMNIQDPNYNEGNFAVRTRYGNCYSDTTMVGVQIKELPLHSNTIVNKYIDLVCAGSSIFLNTDEHRDVVYNWIGPNGFTASRSNVEISNSNTEHSGKYSLQLTGANGCSITIKGFHVSVEESDPASLQTGQWEWDRSVSSSVEGIYNKHIKRDSENNVYVAQVFQSKYIKYSPVDSLKSTGGFEVVVIKYDNSGGFKWVRRMGSIQHDFVTGMDVDKDGNTYISGTFAGPTADFGEFTLTRVEGNINYFIAKLDSSGTFRWVKHGVDSSTLSSRNIGSIKVSASGNCYFIAGSSKVLSLDGKTVEAAGAIGKYTPEGELLWLTPYSEPDNLNRGSLSLDLFENCYVAGKARYNSFVSKFDANGNFVFSKEFKELRPGKNEHKTFIGKMDITVSADGNIYIAIPLHYKANSPTILNIYDDFYIVVMKLDSQGNISWLKYINENNVSPQISTDGGNNLYITGDMGNRYSCSKVNFSPYPGEISYVTKFLPDGTWDWTKPFRGKEPVVSVSRAGEIFLSFTREDNMFVGKLGQPVHVMGGIPSQICSGQPFQVSYSIDPIYKPGNVFKIQLSDEKGSFDNATDIGSVSSVAAGSISGTIPLTVKEGNNYRLRIVSTMPARVGNDNGFNIIINRPAIFTGDLASVSLCRNETLNVPFTVGNTCGFYSGNYFKVQLSDQYGLFNNPVNLDSIQGTGSGNVLVTIPDSIPYGTKYRFRVVSTIPAVAGKASESKLTIYGRPVITAQSNRFCQGSPMELSATLISGASYKWSGPNGFTSDQPLITVPSISKSDEGLYKLSATIGSCQTDTSEMFVKVYQKINTDSTAWKWAKNHAEHPVNLRVSDMKTDLNGNVFTYGYFVNSPGLSTFFLIKSDSLGNIFWRNPIAVTRFGRLSSYTMQIDNSGYIYVAGDFSQELELPSKTVTSYGYGDIFLIKVSNDGNVEWSQTMGGPSNYEANPGDHFFSMSLDKDNNPVIFGRYNSRSQNSRIPHSGKFSFNGGEKIVPHSSSDNPYFAVTYSSSGDILNLKEFDFQNIKNVQLNVDRENNYILTGNFQDKTALDSTEIDSLRIYSLNGSKSAFIAKFNSHWKLQWTQVIGGSYDNLKAGLDKKGNIYASLLKENISLPGLVPVGDNFLSLNKAGSNYLAKYSPDGEFQWLRESGFINKLFVDQAGNSYAALYRGDDSPNCQSFRSDATRELNIVKYNTDGEFEYIAKSYNHSDVPDDMLVRYSAITATENGSVYVVGDYVKGIQFDGVLVSGGTDFLAKLSYPDSIPFAYFEYSGTCNPDSTVFINKSFSKSGAITSYLWNFDDPSSGALNESTLKNPKHKFTASGSYKVSLTVTTEYGYKNIFHQNVIMNEKPEVNIKTSGGLCTSQNVSFNAEASNYNQEDMAWLWDFDDVAFNNKNVIGNRQSNQLKYIYNNPGDYNVKLSAIAKGCTSLYFTPLTIAPNSSVLWEYKQNCLGDTTIFDAYELSNDLITSWRWDLEVDDHETLTVFGQHAKYKYPEAFFYEIKLVYQNKFGCKDSLSDIMEIFEPPVPAFEILDSCIEADVMVEDKSYTPYFEIVRKEWSVQPGNIVVYGSPDITISSPGMYTLQLVVEDELGCKDTTSKIFQVIGAKPMIIQNGDYLETDIYNSYQWMFNGIEIKDAIFRNYKPLATGNYQVIGSDADGCIVTSDPYTVDIITGFYGVAGKEIQLHPNPVNNILIIDFISLKTEQIEIDWVNELGITVQKESVEIIPGANKVLISCENLVAGVYHVVLGSASERVITKVVVVK